MLGIGRLTSGGGAGNGSVEVGQVRTIEFET